MTKSSYSLIVFHETERAILCGTSWQDRENDDAFWLPLSQIEIIAERRSPGGVRWCDIEVPDWLAEERGLDPSLDGEVLE